MRGTPTFLINGTLIRGSRSIGELSGLIEAAGTR
jgi:protein-disulfide isomerase